jgi:hypothetical protein
VGSGLQDIASLTGPQGVAGRGHRRTGESRVRTSTLETGFASRRKIGCAAISARRQVGSRLSPWQTAPIEQCERPQDHWEPSLLHALPARSSSTLPAVSDPQGTVIALRITALATCAPATECATPSRATVTRQGAALAASPQGLTANAKKNLLRLTVHAASPLSDRLALSPTAARSADLLVSVAVTARTAGAAKVAITHIPSALTPGTSA